MKDGKLTEIEKLFVSEIQKVMDKFRVDLDVYEANESSETDYNFMSYGGLEINFHVSHLLFK